MKYHCSGCDYMYDELIGDEDLAIAGKTFFSSLPNDFFCPICDTHRDDFVILPEIIHTPISLQKMTPKESEHIPVFTIKQDKIFFEIDEDTHPNEKEHFIYKIALFDENLQEIESKNFEIGDEYCGEFDIEYMDRFELRVYCSAEGIFSTGYIEI